MKIRRCCLCDGKVVNGICTECGMHNAKQESDYHLNESSCDREPLTHVHREHSFSSWDSQDTKRRKQEETKERIRRDMQERKASRGKQISGNPGKTSVADYNRQYRTGTKPKSRKNKSIWAIIITLLVICNGIIPAIVNLVDEISVSEAIPEFMEEDYMEDEYDPYEYLEKELAQTGASYQTVLTAGNYIVGIDIPEGQYYATVLSAQGGLSVSDYDSGIYLHEYLGDGSYEGDVTQMDDIRLFNGAQLSITGAMEVELVSENAQTDTMQEPQANPLTDAISLSNGHFTAGIDFPAGTYDLIAAAGYGSVDIMYLDEDGEEYYRYYYYMDADMDNGYDATVVRNVVIPEGDFIVLDEISLELIPSERIIDEDYASYYDYY